VALRSSIQTTTLFLIALALAALPSLTPPLPFPAVDLAGGGSHLAGDRPLLPLAFEAKGRGSEASFSAVTDGLALTLEPDAVALSTDAGTATMRFHGASAPSLAGDGPLPARLNRYKGSDRASWQTGVPLFERVRYSGLYPGIDAVFYGNEETLEFDFVAALGADPSVIILDFAGIGRLSLDAGGSLLLHLSDGLVTLRAPRAYQETGPLRKVVQSAWMVRDERSAALSLGEFDRSRTLVIDPELVYGSYLGASRSDSGEAVATDGDFVYFTGSASSPEITGDPPEVFPDSDIFVAKIDPAKTGADSLLYLTVLGGDDVDNGHDIAAQGGNAYLAGNAGEDFPIVGGFQAGPGGSQGVFLGWEAVVARLNASGEITYSSYLGGSGPENSLSGLNVSGIGTAVDIGPTGHIYLVGTTGSEDFPTRNAYDSTLANPDSCSIIGNTCLDVYAAEFDPDKTGADSLVYSTLLGGMNADLGTGIAVQDGKIYLAGYTISEDFPASAGAFQDRLGSDDRPDAFMAVLDPSLAGGTQLRYATYLGGSKIEGAIITGDPHIEHHARVDVGPGGLAAVTGVTESSDFPATPGALQVAFGGGDQDGFVALIDPSLSGGPSLVYSTYLGGAATDGGNDIEVDEEGRVHVAGFTASSNFPVTGGAQQEELSSVPVYKTSDGGATWQRSGRGLNGAPTRFVDMSMTISRADGRMFYVDEDSGVYRSEDGGASWQQVNGSQKLSQILADPESPGVLYAQGFGSGGFLVSEDGGETWPPRNTGLPQINGGVWVNDILVPAGASSAIYAAVQRDTADTPSVYKTTNQGGNWTPLPALVANVTNLMALDPSEPSVIYVTTGFGEGLHRYTGSGAWTKISDIIPVTLTIDPQDPMVMYAGLTAFDENDPAVKKSTNGGSTWNPSDTGLPRAETDYFPTPAAIAVDPEDSQTLYVSFGASSGRGGGVYKSMDGGQGWMASDTGLDAPDGEALLFHPADSSLLFALATPGRDAFLAVLDPSQQVSDQLVYGSFFGGGDDDEANGLAPGGEDVIYLAGATRSAGLELPGGFQPAIGDMTDGFLAAIDLAGGGSGAIAGDANCDGVINSIDALVVLRVVAGLPVTAGCLDAADVNCSGSLTATDSLSILRYVAGLPVSPPDGCRPIGT
jgi:photosystem II stability/assembly factor-like uncharacterized protein